MVKFYGDLEFERIFWIWESRLEMIHLVCTLLKCSPKNICSKLFFCVIFLQDFFNENIEFCFLFRNQ
jgi:hypothetical protein